ncbi:MAG: hypothetical protein IKM97_06130 [Clostridia bacterium]|nr:hypothetical protein [Clostridia bacterium]
MKKLIFKWIIIILSLVIMFNFFTAISFADNENFSLSNYGKNSEKGMISDPIKKVAVIVISVFRIVGMGIALIMILVISMKYMIASPGDRADIQKSSIQYIIGAIVLFASSGILKMLVDFFNKFND